MLLQTRNKKQLLSHPVELVPLVPLYHGNLPRPAAGRLEVPLASLGGEETHGGRRFDNSPDIGSIRTGPGFWKKK